MLDKKLLTTPDVFDQMYAQMHAHDILYVRSELGSSIDPAAIAGPQKRSS